MTKKIDKILLVSPNFLLYPQYDYIRSGASIGCASLAAILKEHLHLNVIFIDMAVEGFWKRIPQENGLIKVGLTEEEFVSRIQNISPSIVGVSNIHTRDHKSALDICRITKKVNPEIITVMGGNNPSGNFKSILKNNFVDFVIIGEGEIAFVKLIKFLEGKLDFDSLDGVAIRKNSNVIIAKNESTVADFEDLPDPDWQIFNKQLYNNEVFHTGCLHGAYAIDFFTSKGCPGNCDYCCSPLMWKRKFRCINFERLINQLKKLRKLGYDEIILHDDNLLVNSERAIGIFRILNEMGFFWTLMGGLDRSRVTPRIIDAIIANNCSRVHYSVESANLDILRRHHKFDKCSDTQLNETPNHVKKFADGGVEIFCDFMIGFPEETTKDIYQTINYAKFLKELGMNYAEFSCVTPFPSTALYKRCLNRGYIVNPNKYEDYTLTKGNITTENFTADQITEIRMRALEEVNGPELFRETRERLHRPKIECSLTKDRVRDTRNQR